MTFELLALIWDFAGRVLGDGMEGCAFALCGGWRGDEDGDGGGLPMHELRSGKS
jgi:hypothetical protein